MGCIPKVSGGWFSNTGFTLAEISVVLLVTALAIGGLLFPISTQLELARARDTQSSLESIREALLKFARDKKRLPCPADQRTPAGDSSAGRELYTDPSNDPSVVGVCSRDIGTVPWLTLGTPETDAWGRRFTYQVDLSYANEQAEPDCPVSTQLPPPSFCVIGPSARLQTRTRTQAGPTLPPSQTGLVAIVVSHGKNGYYAYLGSGLQMAYSGGGANPDEALNRSGDGASPFAMGPAFFVERQTMRSAGACDDMASALCEFDDQLVTLSQSALVDSMLKAGRLP